MPDLSSDAATVVYLKKQVVPDEVLLTERVSIEWHVWQSRLQPYHDLAPGDRVIMVDGGPDTGSLTWEVEVIDVVRAQCDDVEDAWQLVQPLAATAALTEDEFRADPFTQRLASRGRWVIAWTYRPLSRIDQPRVRGEHDLQQHGWAAVPEVRLGGARTKSVGHRGQGRIQDPVLRRKVELAAMDRVYMQLLSDGWAATDIRDTSATKPYDFEVGSVRSPQLRVAVKGTINDLGDVIVTPAEVESALTGGVRTMLAIVYNQQAVLDGTSAWQVTGGDLWRDDDWSPASEQLRVIQYRYRPGLGGGAGYVCTGQG